MHAPKFQPCAYNGVLVAAGVAMPPASEFSFSISWVDSIYECPIFLFVCYVDVSDDLMSHSIYIAMLDYDGRSLLSKNGEIVCDFWEDALRTTKLSMNIVLLLGVHLYVIITGLMPGERRLLNEESL
jgi:hypothetical protein